MNKNLLFLFIIFISYSVSITAQDADGFDKVVNFDVSLKELDTLAKNNKLKSLGEKYLVLNGAVSEYMVTDAEDESYTVEVVLVNGEWSGVSDVFIYRSIIVFKGAEYKEKFPARRRSTPSPGEIPVNTGLIVVAKFAEVRNEGGMVLPVLDGRYLRVYK
ncbi:MAG: hypothetical protein RBT69_01050 [Spirochaetia bacterium]|jgi:hypothetical protein|nr:hypothetical protein [Spirochaetia bacterium]